jgi:CRP-like cAMP-binding protein
MSGDTSPSRALVQFAGAAYRIRAERLKQAFDERGQLHELLMRYTRALMSQIAQTAVCYRHHSLEQQLCRWLLMRLDRIGGNELELTQEAIGHLLGVRRAGVCELASKLQREGAIAYSRGRIVVLERARLEARSCECYGLIRHEQQRLLPRHA